MRETGPGRVDLAVVDRLAGYTLADDRGVARVHVPGRGEANWHLRLVPGNGGAWLISTLDLQSG